MTNTSVLPELKQIVGALLFAAREPLATETIKKVFKDAAKQFEGPVQDFGKVSDKDIEEAVKRLNDDLNHACVGIHVGEVANGYRLENDMNCGIWIRQMLEKGRSNRLSKPALETLAIIAYRQPCTRSEIEAVRGVAVDSIMKNLIEMQLVKVVGRSELPGRPWLHATTKKFLEYFGLKNIDGLPGVEELKRMEEAKQQADSKRNEAIQEELPEYRGEKPAEEADLNADEQSSETVEDSSVVDLEESEAIEHSNEEEEDQYDDDDEFDEDDEDDNEEEYDDDDEDDRE